MVKKICIIGTGWYGCYVAEYLIDNYPNPLYLLDFLNIINPS